ncbi:hypothetical protein Hypma_013130 [Hypsizygus marmoreus]|uniref:Mid2 domain-containing protein n=1 Tax=Hypsizygus marmoreus TaxID=39966 RepID=A0A369JM35_HYPMA|nr:hypothetical protein Hypma_013130 [Hypsizygus marmoreus]
MYAHHWHAVLLAIPWLTFVSPAFHLFDIDDQNSLIIYKPAESWDRINDTFSAGGTYMTTSDPKANATFVFLGTHIYFKSPLWPHTVNTAISLDSGPPFLLDLVDHIRPESGTGDSTEGSSYRWTVIGLANTEHTLVISVGAGQRFAIVDVLTYGYFEPGDFPEEVDPQTFGMSAATISSVSATESSSSTTTSTTASATPPTTSDSMTSSTLLTTTSPAPSASTSSNPKDGSSISVLPIALGIGLGVGVTLIAALALLFCYRRRKRRASRDGPATDHPPSGSTPMAESSLLSSPLSSSNDIFVHPAHNFPTMLTWNSPQSDSSSVSPILGAMPPATTARLANPHATEANSEGDVLRWQEAGQQYIHLPTPHRPGTPSSMTGTSTPIFSGRGTPLLQSQSSRQTELGYHDPGEGNSERASSLPSNSSRPSNLARPGGKEGFSPKVEDNVTVASPTDDVPPPAYTLHQ